MTYWILHITILGLLSYGTFRLSKSPIGALVFWSTLGLKLLAGVILGFIFLDYYGSGDTITFFEMAKADYHSAHLDEPRTRFFVSIIRPIVLLSGESYWITSLWLSFISFLACWRATSTLTVLYPKIRSLFVICLLLTPSVVFWSSGLMKDAIIFAAFVTVVSLVVKIHKHSKITIVDILLLLLGGFLLLKLKHYLLITSMLFFGIILANRMLYQIKGKTRWIIAAISLIVIIGTTQYIHPYLRINRIAWTLYDINQTIHANEDETHLDIVIVDASWNSVLTQIPKALHAGLLRPSILDTTPSWGWIHKVENLLLTLCMMLSILILIKKKIRIDWPLLTASAICILLLATMLPLSTPNFGSLVRYKNAFFPFLLLLTSILPFHYFYSDSVE